eukprot:354383-Pleurochrysis_carterae.AAC.1
MDALMRARDVAAQHSRAVADAQRAHAQVTAEVDADIARQRSNVAAQHPDAKANAQCNQDDPVANRHSPRDHRSPLINAASADAQPPAPDSAQLDP